MLYFILPFQFLLLVSSSLVNHWSFNNDLTKDEIGTAHLYDAVNATLTVDRHNMLNSALRLNDGFIKVPSGVYFTGDFTISAWIKVNSARHFARILEFGNGAYSDNIELSLKDTTYYVHLKTWFMSETKGFLDASSPLKPNEWTHVAAVLSGGIAKLYYNAVLVATGTQFSPRSVIRRSNYIGKGNFPGDQNADATYDEIKIFDNALSEREIREEAGISLDGLINYWSFNGNLNKDEVGTAHLYNEFNANLTIDRFKKPNSALRLINGHLMAPPGLYFRDSFTITAWIKVNSENIDIVKLLDFSADNVFDGNKLVLGFDKSEIFFYFKIKSQIIVESNSFINSTLINWSHIAVIVTDETLKIYCNGSLQTYSQISKHDPIDFITTYNLIGSLKPIWHSDASVDEIKIFDRALNINEIEKEANHITSGLIHYWSFDESIRDEINNENLYESFNAYSAVDRLGNQNFAIKLNNGYLRIPNGVYFNGDFTITAWIKLNANRYYARILDIGNGRDADNIILSTYCESSSYVCLWVINDKKHGFLKSSTQLKIDKWTHIAAVLNSTKAEIYINGILDSNGLMLVPKNVTRVSNYIGKSNWGHDQNADALYDEIKIFNRALSPLEISDDARKNNIIFNSYHYSFDNELIHYWSFSGNTKDEIGIADLYDGVNAYLTEDRFGNSNSALELENGFYKVPTNVYFGDKFTITVWIKLLSTRYNSKIIDFGDGIEDNVAIGTDELTGYVKFFIFDESSKSEIRSNLSIKLNQWTHIAVVFNKGIAQLYINGTLDITGALYIPRNVLRTTNFIGKSNSGSHKNAHAVYDEIKIFIKPLSSVEIREEMNNAVEFKSQNFNYILVVTLFLIAALVFVVFGYIIFKKSKPFWFFKPNEINSLQLQGLVNQ